MKRAFQRIIPALAMTVLSSFSIASEAIAFQFDQKEVEQDRFVAIAVERNYGPTLLVLEQISDSQACWSESGYSPVEIDPLLLNFDFTGICGRATDSNGYSVRMAGQDLAMSHSLSVQKANGDILLVATSRNDPSAAPIIIGRTNGVSSTGFTKIILEEGWRFTKRMYGDRVLGHFYMTSDFPAGSQVSGNQTNSTKDNDSEISDSNEQNSGSNDSGRVASEGDSSNRRRSNVSESVDSEERQRRSNFPDTEVSEEVEPNDEQTSEVTETASSEDVEANDEQTSEVTETASSEEVEPNDEQTSEGTEIASSEDVETDNTRQYDQYAEILKAWRDRILELRNK